MAATIPGAGITTPLTLTEDGNLDTLTLTSTDADANSGPNLRLYRNSGSPAVGDNLGQIDFEGRNDNSEDVVYASMMVRARDETDGTEDGGFQLDIMQGGTLRSLMKYYSDGAAQELSFNDDSIDVDFRVESDGNTHMLFVDGGNNLVGMGTNAPENILHLKGAANTATTLQIEAATSQYTPKILFDGVVGASADYLLGQIGASWDTHTNLVSAIRFESGSDTTNKDDGIISFWTSAASSSVSERMRITGDGHVYINTTSSVQSNVKFCAVTTQEVAEIRNSNASFTSSNSVLTTACKRTASGDYRLIRCVSGNGSDNSYNDNEFLFQGNGNAFADGSFSGGGADYAEYFEWKDSNSSSEDRRGYSVVLDGNKIVKATDSDDASKIIGVVSSTPVVVGDSDIDDKWKSKYLKDDLGSYILEDYTATEWIEVVEDDNDIEHSYATDRIPSDVTVPSDAVVKTVDENGNKFTRKKLNPDWDSSKTYVMRKDRKEWDAIGLMGKLRILKGQPTGTSWIKMRDISDTVEEWLVR